MKEQKLEKLKVELQACKGIFKGNRIKELQSEIKKIKK